MACNPKKKDYYHNKSRYREAYGQAYQVLDLAERYTAYGECSPRDPVSHTLLPRENSLQRFFMNHSGIPGVTVVHQGGDSGLGNTFGYGTPVIQGTHYKEQTLAIALARFKKRAQYKAILAMEYLAERRTLANQLLSICKKMVEVARLLKNRQFKTVWVQLKGAGKKVARRKEMTFHEKWLGYHFAIKPMYDDLIKNINGLTELHTAEVRTRGFYQEDVLDDGWNYTNSYESRLYYTYRVTVYGEVFIDDPAAASRSLVGLTSGDLYDVVPFSFLLDWLFNVGQIIKGLLIPGITYNNTSITILEKRHTEHWGDVNPSLNPTATYSQIGGGYHESSVDYNRVAAPLPDIPLVWNGGIDSLWRAVTAIALARTLTS